MLHLVLYQPLIPPNTGNIARQCVGMKARLHLIHPLGFNLTSKAVQRAGLDYWPNLDLLQHPNPDAFLLWLQSHNRSPWLITKRGHQRYDQPQYHDEDVLIFGNEDTGLPHAWHQLWPNRRLYIPMPGPVRSYNLANSAAIVLAHAMLSANLYPPADQPALP